MVQTQAKSVIALDVGERRIGVARASLVACLASPLVTFKNDAYIWENIKKVCDEQAVGLVIIGLPRGMDGQTTAQTHYAQKFAEEAKVHLGLPVQFQDEAVTSKQAERELAGRSKRFQKSDVDALAATYILEDYLHEHPPRESYR